MSRSASEGSDRKARRGRTSRTARETKYGTTVKKNADKLWVRSCHRHLEYAKFLERISERPKDDLTDLMIDATESRVAIKEREIIKVMVKGMVVTMTAQFLQICNSTKDGKSKDHAIQ